MSEHPSVDAVRRALAEYGLEPDVTWFDDAVTTAALAAEALGVDVGQIANSLLFAFDGEPLLVMTSGAHRVDTVWLGEQLGGVIQRADKDMVKAATGQTIGGVSPVGHPHAIRTLVDQDLAQYSEIWAAAGHAKTVFPLSFDDLVRITSGTVTRVEP